MSQIEYIVFAALTIATTAALADDSKPECCHLSIINKTNSSLIVQGKLCLYETYFDGFIHNIPSETVAPNSISPFSKCYQNNSSFTIKDSFGNIITPKQPINSNVTVTCSRGYDGINCSSE